MVYQLISVGMAVELRMMNRILEGILRQTRPDPLNPRQQDNTTALWVFRNSLETTIRTLNLTNIPTPELRQEINVDTLRNERIACLATMIIDEAKNLGIADSSNKTLGFIRDLKKF